MAATKTDNVAKAKELSHAGNISDATRKACNIDTKNAGKINKFKRVEFNVAKLSYDSSTLKPLNCNANDSGKHNPADYPLQ